MNNSELFKQAHSVARETVEQVGDYQVAFTLALRELIAEQKKIVSPVNSFSEKVSQFFSIAGIVLLAIFLITVVTVLSFPIGAMLAVLSGSAYYGLFMFIGFTGWVAFESVTMASDEISLLKAL